MTRCGGERSRPVPRLAAVVLAGLLSLCTGCVTLMEDCFCAADLPPAAANGDADKGNGGKDEKKKDEDEKKKDDVKACKPHPYTLSQAFNAYIHCLRYGPPPGEKKDDKDKDDKKDDKDDKKNGKNGEKDDKKEEKKNGDDKKDDKKDEDKDDKKDEVTPQWFSVHGQGTIISQGNWKFDSPYIGPNSLQPALELRTSETATLYLGARLWEGGELIFDPEIAGGEGLSNVFGLASFPNGEIPRVGLPQPTPYIARFLFRQWVALGDDYEKVEDGPNSIAGLRPVERLTVSVGKFSGEDFLDDNRYSHEPRTQFMNWSIMYDSAWDYPANTRGYDYGAVIELNEADWALRYLLVGEPAEANGQQIDPHVLKAQGQALELELRYKLCCRAGKLRLMPYLNHAHMGDYGEANREMPIDPSVIATRSYRFKYGFCANVEQEITDDLGAFLRAGWNDGHTESWAYTAVDRLCSFGLLLKGRCWCRPDDRVGLAYSFAGLSADHRDYLRYGGLDFIIGDGRLNYALEEVLETFYSWQLTKGIDAALDFQEVLNPAYNADRGPVSILSLRVHFEY